MQVIFAGAAAIAMLALFGRRDRSVRAKPRSHRGQCAWQTRPLTCRRRRRAEAAAAARGGVAAGDGGAAGGMPVPPMPPGTVLPPGSVVLPGGPDLPPLPSPVDLSQLGAPDVQQMWARMMQLAGVAAAERAERGLPV